MAVLDGKEIVLFGKTGDEIGDSLAQAGDGHGRGITLTLVGAEEAWVGALYGTRHIDPVLMSLLRDGLRRKRIPAHEIAAIRDKHHVGGFTFSTAA